MAENNVFDQAVERLIALMNTSPKADWYELLYKTVKTNNLTIEDWNTFLDYAAQSSACTDIMYEFITTKFKDAVNSLIDNDFAPILDRLEQAEETVASYENRVTTLEETAETHTADLDSLHDEDEVLDGEISDVADRATALENAVGDRNEGDDQTAFEHIYGLAEDTIGLRTDLDRVDDLATDTAAGLVTTNSTVTSHTSSITTLNSTVTNHTTAIANANSAITALDGRLDTAESNITTLQVAVADRPIVSVSATGSATTEAKYITVGDTEWKMGGSGGGEPEHYLKAVTTSGNTLSFENNAGSSTTWTPTFPVTKVNNKTDNVVLTASDINTSDSTVTVQAKLTELHNRVENLSGIGKFLAIWSCTTGYPTSTPPEVPYTYHTGDYYRVGTVATSSSQHNYRPTGSSFTGATSSVMETETVAVGDIYFYDGTSWLLQKSGSEGTVQDVQFNGTSVVSGGIANIQFSDGQMSALNSGVTDTTVSAVSNLQSRMTTAETNVTTLQTSVNSKLNKDTSTGSYVRAYTVSKTGVNETTTVDTSAVGNAIVQRDSNGRAKVANPTEAAHIATKSYVDTAVATKSAVSGTNDGTNWTGLTINGTTYGLASGGGAPDAYLVSVSKSGNTLTFTPNSGSAVTYTPSVGTTVSATTTTPTSSNQLRGITVAGTTYKVYSPATLQFTTTGSISAYTGTITNAQINQLRSGDTLEIRTGSSSYSYYHFKYAYEGSTDVTCVCVEGLGSYEFEINLNTYTTRVIPHGLQDTSWLSQTLEQASLADHYYPSVAAVKNAISSITSTLIDEEVV